MQTVPLLLLSLSVAYILQKALALRKALRGIQNLPGQRLLISPLSFIGHFLPKIPYISPGRNQLFLFKHEPFERVGWDMHSAISIAPGVRTAIVLADAAAIKEVTSARARFPKPVEDYGSLSFFGRNIVASEGAEWKKYRKISAPAFSDRNSVLVWEESIKTVKGMFTDLWGDREVITVDHCGEITLPIALFIIGAAEFGRSISWKTDNVALPGYTMSFKDCLDTVTTNVFVKLALPRWAMGLTETLRRTDRAFDELRRHITEMIHERQAEEKAERHDLLSQFLEANDSNLDVAALTESELIGNIYMFLVAGHETTAHTLCFAFGLLALYPDEQQKLYEHIKSVLVDDTDPTYEQMPLLTYVNAVLYETLRMFPAVTGIPKFSAEDTTLTTSNIHGDTLTVPVPKGTQLTLNVAALHYNPRYWEDPHTFRPSRFLGDWPRDAFLPFSAGSRACLGRKVFETEAIAILTVLLARYRIVPKDEPEFTGETFEQRKARVLACRAGLTLTPLRVPLTFIRR
ncbi:cytochrome P450 [Pholiota molesta]|nr:cytochrome P450 [Pholiota molesta]